MGTITSVSVNKEDCLLHGVCVDICSEIFAWRKEDVYASVKGDAHRYFKSHDQAIRKAVMPPCSATERRKAAGSTCAKPPLAPSAKPSSPCPDTDEEVLRPHSHGAVMGLLPLLRDPRRQLRLSLGRMVSRRSRRNVGRIGDTMSSLDR